MGQIRDVIVKHISRYWLIWSVSLILFLFVVLLMTGNNIENKSIDNTGWKWYSELISAALGAAIVTTVTFLLLNGQAKKESLVEQKKKVFENRLKAYESFLELLRDVVVRNKITSEDEKRLQFSIATIGMHANSGELYKLSKNLKGIILKIKSEDSPNSSLWTEVISIVHMFQASLYEGETFVENSQLTKALCNFSNLCTNAHQKVLEYVECMIYSFGFDTFISDRCLFVNIPVRQEAINNIHEVSVNEYSGYIPRNLYITLKIDNEIDSKYEGSIVVYYGRKKHEQKLIEKIFNYPNNKYWIDPNTNKRKKSDFKIYNFDEKGNGKQLFLGINAIYHARILYFKNRQNIELQSIMTDIFSYVRELWAEDGMTVDVKTLKEYSENEYRLISNRFTFRRESNKEQDGTKVEF